MKPSNWKKYNKVCIFGSRSERSLISSVENQKTIDLSMDNSEWEQNEFPKILRKLEEAKEKKIQTLYLKSSL
ncbi:hypothetical protein THOM_2760 [Trachipleistophora hominis]|uniref:Uncharacterized protein n=1 Tax=Trachipleistophora hominis TaxID=72359 RepID=L7JU95_TRAHO|nr:hypothetical protein THOM_2760 [Trachipleistophora hominis]